MKEIPSKTFCSMAWNHQMIEPRGNVRPCCRFLEEERPKEHNLHNMSIEDVFYSDWMKDLRQKMLKGEYVKGCIRCYQEENAGKRSLRQRYHERSDLPLEKLIDIKNPEIKWIELAISNDCNLACRMCDSIYSSKWYAEEMSIYGKSHNYQEKTHADMTSIFEISDKFVHLKFTGGEPLMIKDHWKLLNKMVSEGSAKNIFLNYSTNCTIPPKKKFIDIWDNFQKVEFALSFDTCDPAEAEYIRWPVKYSHYENTTKEFLKLAEKDNYFVINRATISILNIWNFPETLLWWYNQDPTDKDLQTINPSHLRHPYFLSVTVLPKKLKEKISQKFNKFKNKHQDKINIVNSLNYMENYMWSNDDSKLIPQLEKYIKGTDKFRSQNFFEYYPQFDNIFKE